ncbi:MAG: RluA family pseudouridine synthase [Leptospiraceae bacterium]|nr:RluA family pseudouridine synthase [Leptospiraceae bacterium]
MIFTHKIKFSDVGKSLVQFLVEKYTYYSLEEWKKQIKEEQILVNKTKVDIDLSLKLNDEVYFSVENFIEPDVDTNISIVYDDEYLFAVNKSGNLPVHPAGRYRVNNLTTLLSKSNMVTSEIFIINRLDRETSGIVLFAKSSQVASKLGKLFENGKVNKTYICYVEGIFPEKLFANGFLAKDTDSKIRKKKKFSYEKMESSLWEVNTDFALIQVSNGISKIFAYPHTGKIHQIRATLYSIGYPVVGDKMYGYDESLFLEFIETGISKNKYSIQRQALHAYSLEFIHPITKKQVHIEAKEPEDMKTIFQIQIP